MRIAKASLFTFLSIGLSLLLILPPLASAKANDGKGKGNICDHLPNPRGKAKGLDDRCPEGGSSSGVARGDFNNDGFADLAIGVPGKERAGRAGAGAVIVIYGSANGLTATDPNVQASQFWSQDAIGFPNESETGDGFGSALAAGDFNGDGFSDLAIGAPGDKAVRSGVGSIGQVYVIYGSPRGLTTVQSSGVPGAQRFAITDLNIGPGQLSFFAAEVEAELPDGRSFGAALAWGDFNADGFGDLAVGSPEERILGFANGLPGAAGAVGIIFGSRTGLTVARSFVFTQNSPGVPGDAGGVDRFGFALAGGDFNGDGASDLAIGIPLKDVIDRQGGTIEDAGEVVVLFGREGDGLVSAGSLRFNETDLSRAGLEFAAFLAATGNRFGFALAVGDFNGDGLDDLAMSAPYKTVGGQRQAGAVWITLSSPSSGPSFVQFWEQSRVFPGAQIINERDGDGSPPEASDFFGAALAAGDFNGDGRDDLAIGVPFEDVLVQRTATSFEQVVDAGAVNVIYGSADGLSITERRPQFWTQQSINIEKTEGGAERGDRFGTSLTAWNFGLDDTRPTADLAIGVPFEDLGTVINAGAVNVIYGSVSGRGLTFFGDQVWTQNSPGVPVPEGSQTDDRFGGAVY